MCHAQENNFLDFSSSQGYIFYNFRQATVLAKGIMFDNVGIRNSHVSAKVDKKAFESTNFIVTTHFGSDYTK